MKNSLYLKICAFFIAVVIFFGINAFSTIKRQNLRAESNGILQNESKNIKGSWKMISSGAPGETETTVVKIVTDTYFTNASYNKNGEFIGTSGGTYTVDGKNYSEILEYFTWDSTKVGTTNTFKVNISNNKLEFSGNRDGKPFQETWEKIDGFNGSNALLAGAWRIRQRQGEGGKLSTMEWGPRKTLKILSNNRFQWIAYNVEKKEFFGTGGGTYTAKDGKYIEKLEFFSRDPKRVGAQLSFQFEIKDNKWHHKGKSSSGSDIYEVWEKVE